MTDNENEKKLEWLKLLLLAIKTSEQDNKNIKKEREVNGFGKKISM